MTYKEIQKRINLIEKLIGVLHYESLLCGAGNLQLYDLTFEESKLLTKTDKKNLKNWIPLWLKRSDSFFNRESSNHVVSIQDSVLEECPHIKLYVEYFLMINVLVLQLLEWNKRVKNQPKQEPNLLGILQFPMVGILKKEN